MLVILAAWTALVLSEMVILSWLFEFEHPIPTERNPIFLARQAIIWGLLTVAAFAVVGLARPQALRAWAEAVRPPHDTVRPLLVNAACFTFAVVATVSFTASARGAAYPPLGWLSIVFLSVVATAFSLVRVLVPLRAPLRLMRRDATIWAAAAVVAALTLWLAGLIGVAWARLADTTLSLVHGLLSLYEADVAVDLPQRGIGIGEFWITIDQSCSGYEGVALVSTFTSLYLWLFRSHLRMPRALILLPLGIVAIWLLNVARIAALVSLGAHVSPELAVQGFHSQAGWITFLVVTVGLMALSRRSSFFTIAPAGRSAGVTAQQGSSPHALAAADADRALLAHLVPFMAMMLAAIVAAACAPYDHALYGLKVAAAGVALWAFRDVLVRLDRRVGVEAVLVGLLIGCAWIATEPAATTALGGERSAASWLQGQSGWIVAAWLAVRGLGTIVVVPIVEELAFRGFLHRWLIARRFEQVPFAQASLPALMISSVLFGVLHGRWFAAALSGGLFALLMNRHGRLSDPIAAHMIANAVIFAWAVATWQLPLL